jgi:hypothetical protein
MENQLTSTARIRSSTVSSPPATTTLQEVIPVLKKPPAKKNKSNADVLGMEVQFVQKSLQKIATLLIFNTVT